MLATRRSTPLSQCRLFLLTTSAIPVQIFFTYGVMHRKVADMHYCIQVCATIGLCDAQQISTPARKLLAQTLMQAQQTQQDDLPAELLKQIIPAQQRTAEKVGDSTQCQICEMAVNYVKVSMFSSLRGSSYPCPTSHILQGTTN